MKVRVKLFAAAKELAGCDQLTIELEPNATIEDLRAALIKTHPSLSRIAPHSLWAVGTEYAANDTRIIENSEIALIPPVSGG
jgi:molybdopterin converting factor small subunit